MTRYLLLSMTFFGITSAQNGPVPIPIVNSGFAADILSCQPGTDCYNTVVPGWLPGWFNGGNAGTIKPGAAQYPGGVPGGGNVAFIGGGTAGGRSLTGAIFQTLPVKLAANTTYTLTLSIGHRADETFTGYVATLLAGVAIASEGSLSPPPVRFSKM